MKKFKKWLALSGLITLMFTLSGCVDTYKSGARIGEPTGEGIVYNLLVEPMNNIIQYLVGIFNGNYGLAIIVLTIVVRLFLFPLMINQTKKSTYMSEKMQAIKPQTEAIQAKLKAATSPQEQAAANTELRELYAEHNINMFSSMGCLPLLIQMPIFTALFFSIKFADGVKDATFLGIDLGSPNIPLVILAGVAYLVQSYISTIGVSPEQKKQMKMMLIVSPLMIVMISFSSPAGVTLYWVVGGIVSCFQSLYTNLVQKPKIKAQIDEELRLNPPKPVHVKTVTEIVEKEKPVKKAVNSSNANKKQRNTKPSSGINAGRKQNIEK